MQLMAMPSMSFRHLSEPLIWTDQGREKYSADLTSRYYCLSILDKHHHPDIDFEQGLKILRMCTDELKRRLPIDFKGVSLLNAFRNRLTLRSDVGQSHR